MLTSREEERIFLEDYIRLAYILYSTIFKLKHQFKTFGYKRENDRGIKIIAA